MNLRELINEVNTDIDDELDNGYIIGWINRAIDDISPYANHQKLTTIALPAEQRIYPCPSDLIKVVQIVDESVPMRLYELPLNNLIDTGYKVIGTNIVFQPVLKEAREYSLYYEARLPRLVNLDDIPAIRSDFHDLLILYAVARARYQDEEESLMSNAMSEYLARKKEFIYECRKSPMYSIDYVF